MDPLNHRVSPYIASLPIQKPCFLASHFSSGIERCITPMRGASLDALISSTDDCTGYSTPSISRLQTSLISSLKLLFN